MGPMAAPSKTYIANGMIAPLDFVALKDVEGPRMRDGQRLSGSRSSNWKRIWPSLKIGQSRRVGGDRGEKHISQSGESIKIFGEYGHGVLEERTRINIRLNNVSVYPNTYWLGEST
jgi:hypothetical protein